MEQNLYNKHGVPQAYIADDGETIYLWEGHAVAYIHNDRYVYGWNGEHLGFFNNGIIYDLQGMRVGFLRHQSPVSTYSAPTKYSKYAKYSKYSRYSPYARPSLSFGYASEDLQDFLKAGAVGNV